MVVAGTVAHAIDRLAEPAVIDVIVVDWSLPDGDGGRVVSAAADHQPAARLVICSGDSSRVPAHIRAAAQAILEKPFRLEQLDAAVR